VGNVVGPLLYTTEEAPEYARGLRSNLALYCVLIVLVAITTVYLGILNRNHSRRRVALGKSAVILDTSLYSAEEAERLRQQQTPTAQGELVEPGAENREDQVGARAFDNLTDLQNEEFVFVL
jgi:hypothetical protein